MAKTRSSTGNTPRKGASVSGSGTPAKATSTATDLAAAAAAGINGGGMTSRRTASTDSDSSSGASSSNSPSDGGSFFSRTSHSTAGTSPTPSIMAPRKGWSSAQAEVIPRPSHVDPSAPLSPEPLSSDALASRLPDKAFDLDPDFVPHPEDPYCLRHAEFGYDENERYRWTSGQGTGTEAWKQDEQIEPPYYTYLTTYLSYLLLILIGHMRDFLGKRLRKERYAHLMPHNGYAALNSDFDSFYTRRLKTRLDDCFARPVTGLAGRTITLIDRASSDYCLSFAFTGTTTQALNISSYNYLGFAQSRGGCADAVEKCTEEMGLGTAGARQDVGTHALHVEAERLVARFVGAEDALLVSQGFATNSTTLPAFVGKGCLIISDELNHSSIRFGARLSGAMVRQYKHNDMADLEKLLRDVISQGQPRTHRPWKKILIVVEGIYSMEGTIVALPELLELKRKYKFYLYVDEAHSIGALGPRGRGVCDYFGIDPTQIDVLMGTLTKSFGAAGGYIAGTKEVIAHLRLKNHSSIYAESMPLPVMTQIISSMASIMGPECLEVSPSLAWRLDKRLTTGEEGRERLRRLAFNARYLGTGLRKLGFIVYGNRDSPIVPLLIFSPGKMSLFSRLMLERYAIVVVVVAYPATPLVSSRVRFCVSAAHTKEDIDRLLIASDDVGTLLGLKLGPTKGRMAIEDIIANAEELVR